MQNDEELNCAIINRIAFFTAQQELLKKINKKYKF